MIYDTKLQMLFFFQLYSKGSLFIKHHHLTSLSQLTVPGSIYSYSTSLSFSYFRFLKYRLDHTGLQKAHGAR